MQDNRLNFTKLALEALPSPPVGTRSTYHDIHTAGLQIRVTATGKKTFCLYKRAKNGAPERITLGVFGDITVEQARRMALNYKSDMTDGTSPAARLRQKREEITFGKAFEMYITDHAEPEGLKTIDRMRGDFERYLGAMPDEPKKKHGKKRVKSPGSVNWQNKKLSAITTRDIKNLRTSLSKNSGDAAANHALKLVRVVYNKAVEWGEFKGVNPALNPGILKIQSRDRFLQKDELPRLFTALAETENINVRDFILLAILTGARKANVLAMQWREVDLIRREWRIPDTKNGEPVIVQLPLEAVEILSARQAPGATWVFPSKSASGHMTSPKNSVSVILKRAGIENLTIHDLRRTLGSWQAIMGASLAIIGKSLGHKSVAATQIYARLSADPVRESVTRATAAMMEAGGLTQGAGVLNFKKTDRLDSKLTESKPGGNSTSGPSGKRVVRFTFRDGSTSDIDLTEHQEICARQRAELAEDEEKARYILAEAARARRRAKSDAAKAKAQEDRASKDLDSRDAKICSHAKVEKNKQVHGYLERTGRAFDMTAENVKKILDKADNREN